jgi:ATP-dependent helicase/nuclease subunit B
MPAVDEAHLGGQATAPLLVGEALASALGLPGAAVHREAEWRAFRAVLHLAPRVSLLRRRAEDDEPLAPSPWLERLLLERQRQGRPIVALVDDRAFQAIAPRPQARPAPAWHTPAGVPTRVSAAGYERLRTCPYRFHALDALALRAPEELDDALQPQQIGTWLHRSLQRFHDEERLAGAPAGAVARAARLVHIATEELERGPWQALDLLPERAHLPALAQAYVAHVERDEAAHWQPLGTEQGLKTALRDLAGPDAPPMDLEGRIDRIDWQRRAGPTGWRLIDYKTTAENTLKQRVKAPEEDTQLAFYAALLLTCAPALREQGPAATGQHRRGGANAPAPPPAAPSVAASAAASTVAPTASSTASSTAAPGDTVEAGYLSLRGAEVHWIPHPGVASTAQHLVEQLVHDFTRLRQGHPALALGAPPACDTCEAAGLCRRAHWPAEGR